MMDPALLVTLLFLGGIALLVAEVFLPAHGLVGVAGCLSILTGIGLCFYVNSWAGLVVLLAAVIAAPFVGALFVKIYPNTFLGRRLILKPIDSPLEPTTIKVGQTGITTSELKPLGMADFGHDRVEVTSEYGIVPPGTTVRVVAVIDNRPTVRAVDAPAS